MSRPDIMAGWQDALDAGELRFPRCEGCGSWNWWRSLYGPFRLG